MALREPDTRLPLIVELELARRGEGCYRGLLLVCSTVALTDANGAVQTSYTYEPYGNTTASGATSSSSYQFTGRENDGTGLYYYRARYYNPTFGRFASEDPMGFAAGDPNLYGYAGGSPANATDPSGEFVPILLAAAEILAPVAIGCLSGAAFSIGIDLLSHPLGVRKSDMPAFTQKVAHDAVVGCLMGAVMVPAAAKAAVLLDGGAGAFAAEEAAPIIKFGTSGGSTAGKAFPQAVRDAAFAENPQHVCVYCGRPGTGTQVDHAIARVRGGTATIENAQLTCDWCNPSKGSGLAPKDPPPDYEGPWPPSWWPEWLR